MQVLRRSYHGWSRVLGERGKYAMWLIIVAWFVLFMMLLPLMHVAVYSLDEYLLIGDLEEDFPAKDRCAYVTLVTGAAYVRGARVLAHTLKANMKRSWPLIALTVGLTKEQQRGLVQVGWEVEEVEAIPFHPVDAPDNWRWIPEKHLGPAHVNALTKMRVWQMDRFPRVVFIDSDIWALGDVSDLCRRKESVVGLGAGRLTSSSFDVNSGVMSLAPNRDLFVDLMRWWRDEPEKLPVYPMAPPQLRFPDQSLIISYVLNHPQLRVGGLSEKYNLNARKKSWPDVRLIHFNVDSIKPWAYTLSAARSYQAQMAQENDATSLRVWKVVESWLSLEARVNKTYGTWEDKAFHPRKESSAEESSRLADLAELERSFDDK